MINNWDIISHTDPATGTHSFTLVIDGTENDARLIAKKLAGYVQTPEPAQPPFTHKFSLPANLNEETLDKVRTAVQEGSEQANKVNQFVPGGTLGSPLFNGQATSEPSGKIDINPQDSFLQDKPAAAPQPAAPQTPQEAVTAAKPDMPLNDNDMLIKDMEDTMLGKMPLEDILSAETKYDMYLDLENQTLTKNPPAQKDSKIDKLAEDVADVDAAFDIFDQKLKDETRIMDLSDLQAVTSKLSQKDLGFMDHANGENSSQASDGLTSPKENKPEGLMASSVQPNPDTPAEENIHGIIPEETFLGNTMPPSPWPDKTQNSSDGLPDIAIRGDENDSEPLEKTFNFETTLSAELMRTQYEKSFRTESLQPPTAPAAAKPEEPTRPAKKVLLHKKENKPAAPAPAAPVPAPEPEKPSLRLRRKPKEEKIPTPPQPQAPAAPVPAPKRKLILTPKPAPEPVVPPATPAAPAAPKIAQEQPSATVPQEAPAPGLEKTRTIDYSIELPLSELKKHNWPLEVPLLPTYTLENFVLSENRFAHATAISVIDNPGRLYNPLVFHGTTGTGKTHFLNAMAYGFSKKYGQENIFMTNGVRFSRGIQRYVMEGNIEKFEKFMDSVKVLLIDDIHLLAINEQNRAHISRLLNNFLKEQKQIVITSKYPPESLDKLENLIQFRLDSGWISELKTTTGNAYFKIVRSMLNGNGVELTDDQISQFFDGTHITLSTIMRSIRRLKVLENLVAPHMDDTQRSQAALFEKLLATSGEDPNSEILAKNPSSITSISTVGNGEWGRIGFFYPSNSSGAMNWMVYALEQRAKELGISGGFDIAVRSSYSTENIISSAFKIANLCDNKKLRGAVILGPAVTVCEPSVRENFYDILTHMLEIMLIRCGIINSEALRLPSTYVKVISELLR